MVTSIKTATTGREMPTSVEKVTLKILGEHSTHDGIAFSAEVYNHGTLMGVFENSGTGGGTWFHHYTALAMGWWDSLVEDFHPFSEYPEMPGMAHEELADALYEDAALKRDLDRKRSVIVRVGGNNDDIRLYRGKLDPPIREYIRKELAGAEVWVKGKGWEQP